LCLNKEYLEILFDKYQGTGNDFIMLNNMDGRYDGLSISHVQELCDRKFGVGADGLIKMSRHSNADFELEYYNSDGTQSFCGNGSRCAIQYASDNGIIKAETRFMAIDGEHHGLIENGVVSLKMNDVSILNSYNSDYIVDTGSPHYIHFEQEDIDIVEYGKKIRYSEKFNKDGINVNSLRINDGELYIQTYERGVEDETLSCGTGVTACALIAMKLISDVNGAVTVNTKGGRLEVRADKKDEGFVNIWLKGPAKRVYGGAIEL